MPFTDFITIEGTSESGFSLADIDITPEDLHEMVGGEYADGNALAEAKIAFAYKQVANDVLTKARQGLRVSSVLDNERIGYSKDDRRAVTPEANKLKGIYVEFESTDAFLSFTINTLRLAINATGDYNIEIWDFQRNNLLDTIPVSAVSGEQVTVHINKTYSTNRGDFKLGVIYDPAGATSVQTTVRESGCLTCTHIGKHRNIYLEAKGMTIPNTSDKLYKNIKASQETGGLSIDYTLDCDHSAWVASNRQSLAMPILYKAGAAIARYAYHITKRQNSVTNIDSDKWNMLLEEFETKYMEQMTSFTAGMRLPNNNCFCVAKSIAVRHMV